jgi:hypothetical protein
MAHEEMGAFCDTRQIFIAFVYVRHEHLADEIFRTLTRIEEQLDDGCLIAKNSGKGPHDCELYLRSLYRLAISIKGRNHCLVTACNQRSRDGDVRMQIPE